MYDKKGKPMYDNVIVALEDSIKIWNVLVATGGRDKEPVINKLFSVDYLPCPNTGFYKACPLCQYAWEVTGTPGTKRCEACPVDWSWDWGMGKRDSASKLPMYCYDGIFDAWERAWTPVKRVKLAIEIVSRMEAALDMYRSIEDIGKMRYTLHQRIQQLNYNLGRSYHIYCKEFYHPATLLYYQFCALREMNN